MNVLLLRPVPGNERFGLGPFFRTEPLGLEYIARALETKGHRAQVADLRFSRRVEHYLTAHRPALVGIACMHALEIDDAVALAERVRASAPDTFILVGGHATAAYPAPLARAPFDAICVSDGERVVPELARALETGRPLSSVPGLLVREGDGFEATPSPAEPFELDDVPLPLRDSVEPYRDRYACVQYRPIWLVETARGCPFRCSFCSVWPMHGRSVRERSIASVCRDFETTGENLFIADDLFWHHPARSLELAKDLRRRVARKNFLLVQSRVDLVASHPELLEAWRPVADKIDVFFGLEAATNRGLEALDKDTTIDRTGEAIALCRELRYGITGNFVIDPAWDEDDFRELWDFVDEHRLNRAGFTILTPLPGTPFYENVKDEIRAESWASFDMHHLLWEPKLGAERFFELYCETWKRSVLNLSGEKPWWKWLTQTKPKDLIFLARVLKRTQRMMDPEHYLSEHALRP